MNRFNLSAFAVRERAITLFTIIAIIVAGGYAFVHLGRAEDPKFTVKVLTISAVWPGATAKRFGRERTSSHSSSDSGNRAAQSSRQHSHRNPAAG